MNILKYITLALSLAPTVVKGVEVIAGERDSATKHKMAKDALLLATGAAQAIDPANAELTQAVSDSTSVIIDQLVNTFHQVGLFSHKQKAAAAAQ
jgi:hypothetical protein